MTIYFVMLGISMFFAVYAQRAKPFPQIRSSFITFCVLAALPFIIITVFRYRVGSDDAIMYEGGFLRLKYEGEGFQDPGFSLIFWLFGLFTDDAWWAISFVGLLTMIFFFKAFSQQSVMLPLTILIFFLCGAFFQSLTAIRQGLAIAIFLYSIRYLKARDWKHYFLLNLIGVSMHGTAVIYLPLYFLYGVRATPRRCLTLLAAAVVGFPLLSLLMRVIVQVVPRFNRYLEGGSAYFAVPHFFTRTFVTVLFFTLLRIFYLARDPQQDRDFEWMTYLMLIATGILLYATMIPGAQRAAESVSIVQVLSYPMMLKKEKDIQMRGLMAAGIIGLLAVRLLVFEIYLGQKYDPTPWYGVLPYHWVFFR